MLACWVGLVKAFKNVGQVARGNAGADIANPMGDVSILPAGESVSLSAYKNLPLKALWARQATTRLTRVSSARGTVVTSTQELQPGVGRRVQPLTHAQVVCLSERGKHTGREWYV